MTTKAFGYLLAAATAAAAATSQNVDSYSSPATFNGLQPQPQPQPQPWPQPLPQSQPPFEQPSPDVCYQQHSASDCGEWRWCVWDPYSNSCSNARPHDSAAEVNLVSSLEAESHQQPPPQRPSPNVCSQMHSKVDCSNWSFCQWNSATNCCVNPRPYDVRNPDSPPAQPAALIATDTDSVRRPSPDVCPQQQEEDDCTLWSFCTWSSSNRLCSMQTSHHPSKQVSDFVSTSNQAPPQPQPSPESQPNPQPDFCGKQQSKAGCVFWLWCQWDDATHLCWSKH